MKRKEVNIEIVKINRDTGTVVGVDRKIKEKKEVIDHRLHLVLNMIEELKKINVNQGIEKMTAILIGKNIDELFFKTRYVSILRTFLIIV